MLWEEYYTRQENWAISTKINRISKLESFGPPDEVAEVIEDIAFYDEKGAARLIKKAIVAGVKFTGSQISAFVGSCEDELIQQAIQLSSVQFTTADLEDLYCDCDDQILIDIAAKYQIRLPECLAESQIPKYDYYTFAELAAEYDYILNCLFAARNHLQEAHTYSLWGISSEQREWTILKYSHVENAQNSITAAINAWNRLNIPGKENTFFPRTFPFISNSDMWSNFLIDGFWMEVSIKQQIKALIRTVNQAIRAIQSLRNPLG